MTEPTLLVDIGNTRAKWTLVDASSSAMPDLGDVRSVAHDDGSPTAFDRAPGRVLYSNVASPAIATRVLASWPDVASEAFVPSREECGVINAYRDPSRLGPDRWASTIGAHALVPDRDLLVCSFGTATTIDFVTRGDADSGRARFVGGMILPGFDTMRRSLARDTARLPLASGHATDFATDTDDAIASGILAAQVGAIERAIGHARDRGASHPLVLISGGAAAMLVDMALPCDALIEPDLVLRGLAVVARARIRR